jgi:hypothetical protein
MEVPVLIEFDKLEQGMRRHAFCNAVMAGDSFGASECLRAGVEGAVGLARHMSELWMKPSA